MVRSGKMQQLVRFCINLEDKQRIEGEASKLGIASADFLQLLIKAYFNGVRLERGEPASDRDRTRAISSLT